MMDDGTLTMLLRTNERLTREIDRLEAEVTRLSDKLEEQEDAYDEEKQALALRAAEDADALARAVRTYFSWVESPPQNIDPKVYSEVLARFRSDMEAALRTVES